MLFTAKYRIQIKQMCKQPLSRLTGHAQAVNHISFSPDGRYFASAGFDKKVKVWDGFTGKFKATLTGHVGAVYQVRLSHWELVECCVRGVWVSAVWVGAVA